MKKIICLLLSLIMAFSVLSVLAITASAEEKAFVIDGELDSFYRKDDWAKQNGFYRYYNNIDDTSLLVVSKQPGQGNGTQDLAVLWEEVTVEIYAAYDDHYAYFYVDVMDPDIATYVKNADGSENAFSQYIENIDFYVDTDPKSCEGNFCDNEKSLLDADTHFRVIAHNMWIGDCQGTPAEGKYTLALESATNPAAYFKDTKNVFPFQHFDDDGKLIGYGCEARFPLASFYGEDYDSVYYNIAVTNHATEDDDTVCALTTGYRWWLAYDTGITFYQDEVNPFFNFDPDKSAADSVDYMIKSLPEEINTYDGDAIAAARAAYEALTEKQKGLVTMLEKLVAAEEKYAELTKAVRGDVNGDELANASDALLILKYAVHKAELTDKQKQIADLNEDTRIDASDALIVLKIAVHKA